MTLTRQLSLIIAITIWGSMIGGVMYTHIVYFPAYLSHLPESNKLITGDFGIHDGNFWMLIHPIAILTTLTTLILNWKLKARRKLILATTLIYLLVLIATATYFVPELLAFADSSNDASVSVADLYERGQTWQHLSWIRGFFVYTCFILMVVALTKSEQSAQNEES